MSKDLVVVQQEQMSQLMTLALNENAPIEKLERLMDLQERWETKNSERAFYDALSLFQSECPIIDKKGVTYNGTPYAKLEDISIAIKKMLAKTSLGYRFEQEQDIQSKMIKVTCIVSHKDGFSKETSMAAPADTSGNKNFIQAIGSTITYLKRYTLTGALGIAVGGEDTDGQDYEQYQEPVDTYPDEEFKKNFPNWEKAILAGKKTPDQIIKSGNAQGITFSTQQLLTIEKVGNA